MSWRFWNVGDPQIFSQNFGFWNGVGSVIDLNGAELKNEHVPTCDVDADAQNLRSDWVAAEEFYQKQFPSLKPSQTKFYSTNSPRVKIVKTPMVNPTGQLQFKWWDE